MKSTISPMDLRYSKSMAGTRPQRSKLSLLAKTSRKWLVLQLYIYIYIFYIACKAYFCQVVECSTPAPCQICTETRTDVMHKKYELPLKKCNLFSHQYFGMECGHMFCGSCWKRYISSNLFMLPMICMQNGCKQRVIFDFVYKNITDEQLRLRYKRERLIAFLDSHRLGSQW